MHTGIKVSVPKNLETCWHDHTGWLTDSERLFIDRRRRHETQYQAARRLGVSRWKYCRYETGEDNVPIELVPGQTELQPFEACAILRRRMGLKQINVADKIGVCRWWLNQMERGVVPYRELVNYWNRQLDG